MKRKHHGLVAVISGVAALVAVGTFAASGVWCSTEGDSRFRPPKALNIKMPTDQQVRQMESLYVRLDQLAAPSVRPTAAKTLTLFGYHDNSAHGQDADENDQGHAGHGQWQLSLTVRAGINSYCVINGTFLAEGARMADGTQVIQIENHRVLVSDRQEQHWLYLDNALPPSVSGAQHDNPNQRKGQT